MTMARLDVLVSERVQGQMLSRHTPKQFDLILGLVPLWRLCTRLPVANTSFGIVQGDERLSLWRGPGFPSRLKVRNGGTPFSALPIGNVDFDGIWGAVRGESFRLDATGIHEQAISDLLSLFGADVNRSSDVKDGQGDLVAIAMQAYRGILVGNGFFILHDGLPLDSFAVNDLGVVAVGDAMPRRFDVSIGVWPSKPHIITFAGDVMPTEAPLSDSESECTGPIRDFDLAPRVVFLSRAMDEVEHNFPFLGHFLSILQGAAGVAELVAIGIGGVTRSACPFGRFEVLVALKAMESVGHGSGPHIQVNETGARCGVGKGFFLGRHREALSNLSLNPERCSFRVFPKVHGRRAGNAFPILPATRLESVKFVSHSSLSCCRYIVDTPKLGASLRTDQSRSWLKNQTADQSSIQNCTPR